MVTKIVMAVLMVCMSGGFISGERCFGAGRGCVCTHDWKSVSCIGQGLTEVPDIAVGRRQQVEIFNLQGNAIRLVRVSEMEEKYPNLRQIDVRGQHTEGRCVRIIGRMTGLRVLTDCEYTTETQPTTHDSFWPSIGFQVEDGDATTTIPDVTSVEQVTMTPSEGQARGAQNEVTRGIFIAMGVLTVLVLTFILHCITCCCQSTSTCTDRFCKCCPRPLPRYHRTGDDAERRGCAVENLSFESVELFAVPRSRYGTK